MQEKRVRRQVSLISMGIIWLFENILDCKSVMHMQVGCLRGFPLGVVSSLQPFFWVGSLFFFFSFSFLFSLFFSPYALKSSYI